jgi:hypothetical protein
MEPDHGSHEGFEMKNKKGDYRGNCVRSRRRIIFLKK